MMPNGHHDGDAIRASVNGGRARQLLWCLFWFAISLGLVFSGDGLLLQITGFALMAGGAAEIRRIAGVDPIE